MKAVSLAALAQDPEPRYVELAKNQPPFETLPCLIYEDGMVLTEWELTESERTALIRGERIRLWVMCGRDPEKRLRFAPVRLEVTSEHKA